MKTIDGSRGEGGGQVVRTTMALAMITGQPVRLENVRARRAKPGLMRQHLTGVLAAAAVSGGKLRGAELRSTAFEFEPGEVRGGTYEFAVGTAGSVALVLQTILPALMARGCDADITIEGGSHAKMAPPFDFLDLAWGRAVRDIGHQLHLTLERYGFYPAGGARLHCVLRSTDAPQRLELLGAPDFASLRAVATLCEVPEHVAERELDTLRSELDALSLQKDFETRTCTSRSSGNVLHVVLEGPLTTEVFTGFGERGVRAEALAAAVAGEVREFLDRDVPVGPHLADQLIVLASIGAGGSFRTGPLTLHARTLVDLIPELIDVEIEVHEEGETVLVEVRT